MEPEVGDQKGKGVSSRENKPNRWGRPERTLSKRRLKRGRPGKRGREGANRGKWVLRLGMTD